MSTDREQEQTKTGPSHEAITSLGTLEGYLLRLLWDAGEPQSSVQVYESMYFARKKEGREMQSPSTIAVTLSRMVEKKLLTISRQGTRKGYYAPTKSRAEVVAALLDATSRRLVGQPLGYILNGMQKPTKGAKAAETAPGIEELVEEFRRLQQTAA